MNRIQTACYCLIASALVLSGLLVVQLSEEVGPNEAEATLVIARENFTLLTAETREDEESLFILDNTTGTVLIYRLDIASKKMELANGLVLREIFDGRGRGGDDDNRRRR
ncbi:MAG: hypothetical protein AAF333_10465 [Planctomycetota bacterium]